MKIIDRYILVSYLKTFASVFVILMFIFVLQTIWLYIAELAGKDLDLEIIFKFLLYFSPKLIPLVLPLTILVSSIMVFGSFAEKYEFAAMKSTGISLQRAMRSLMVFVLILSATAFVFANNVIPYAEYKSLNLRKNIAQLKPAIAVVEGQFSDIGDITIKVDEKSGEKGEFLDDVIIHKKDQNRRGNFTVIKAKKGELISAEGSNTLSLKLFDGNYYDDIQTKDPKKHKKRPFVKSYFEEYIINIDLSEINNIDLEEEQEFSNQKMYKISELNTEIDSLSRDYSDNIRKFSDNLVYRTGFTTNSENYKPAQVKNDSVDHPFDAFKIQDHSKILGFAISNVKNSKSTITAKENDYKNRKTRLNKYEIALHEKYVIGFSCVILFFVGAPLGAIIRKGGMGLPMVVAIILFLAYHFIGIFAKNNAENDVMAPWLAAWFSSLIMLPLSVWLTYRATTDQGIFNPDVIVQPVNRFFRKLFKIKEKDEGDNFIVEDLEQEIDISEQDSNLLENYEDKKLIDIVKFYRKYGYSKDYRIAALKVLFKRGITQEDLKFAGNLYDTKQFKIDLLIAKMKGNFNKTTFVYILSIILPIIVSVLEIDNKLSPLFVITVIFSLINFILFYIFFFRLITTTEEIEKLTNDKDSSGIFIFMLLGFPFYIFFYFYFKQRLSEILKQ